MAGRKNTSKARAVKRASPKPEPALSPPAKPRAKAKPKPAAPAQAAPSARQPKPKPQPKPKQTESLASKLGRKVRAVAAAATETVRRRGLPKPASAPQAQRVTRPPRKPQATRAIAAEPLTEEERIESSKYDVREPPRRVFEEERFLFPETYESDRVRLLVKDPEWLFAHWDVSPGSLQRLRDDLGERATALSRLTLRLLDPADGALSVVLLPEGARSWYVKTHSAQRAYRAALGVTMPSGEFRPLATSNVVVAPSGVPSPQKARRRLGFARAQAAQAAAELERTGGLSAAAHEHAEASPQHAAEGAAAGAGAVDYIDGSDAAPRPESAPGARGGASDTLGPGGASDTFRR